MTVDHRAQARAALVDIGRERDVERWIEARGSSMIPIIRPGDRLLVAIGSLPVRIGQVVIVQRDNRSVAHRIVGRRRNEALAPWITKGDAELLADAPFAVADVIGIVLAARGADGSTRRRGFDGPLARLVALASGTGGRIAWMLRRAGTRMPRRPASIGLRFLLPLTRVPTRLISAPIPWLDQETRAEGR